MAFIIIMFSAIALFLLASCIRADIQLNLINYCEETVWPGVAAAVPTSPFERGLALAHSQSKSYKLSIPFTSGRIWPKLACNSTGAGCRYGDCGSADCLRRSGANSSLVEFTVTNTTIFYDISIGKLFMSAHPVILSADFASGCLHHRSQDRGKWMSINSM